MSTASAHNKSMTSLAPIVVMLFFAWGFATSIVDAVIPKLKEQFSLNYTEAMLVQFAFFLAYFVVSVPAGALLARLGYLRGIVAGLSIMTLGCLLFVPASSMGLFGAFLLALFVMAGGITVLQVAANPLMSLLGRPETASSRLNLAQAFNSFGTTIGPILGSVFILSKAADGDASARGVHVPFLMIAGLLIVLAVLFWFLRGREGAATDQQSGSSGLSVKVLRHSQLALGVVSIFVYVGAEVSIGSAMVNYLILDRTRDAASELGTWFAGLMHLHDVLNTPESKAAVLVSLYWGGAMVGRFIGSVVLRFARPGIVLMACSLAAALLVSLSMASTGTMAMATILSVGLCNSIMFPTIFTIAIDGLEEETPQGAGMLCLAIFGGAVVPMITGKVADMTSLVLAFIVPVACYLMIAGYGLLTGLHLLSGKPATKGSAPRAVSMH
ncbi:sugar MFS transporter [Nitrospirillum pindoramense]|uniref:FHS family L-fucose permease-like MFS transporter n=1 Tax=Nitrospirillum amazonense TaxID=28077 RepID=A0A560HBY0_9PROT|nr:sugar MFS transporter [Nitrospirillum amazonense]TWB43878.1 FHS family L-fucose permease-like MFS transporter [Nitrospirillum amazonense]